MTGVFLSLQRLVDGSLDALSSRFTRWTKPLGTSLPLATLTDLGKSKSQLIAENALLRQQLIVLRRQVKRPSITRTDRMLFVLLARLVQTWQQTQMTRATRDAAARAAGALWPRLEAQVKGSCSPAQGCLRNHRVDEANDEGQSASSVLNAFVGNC